MNLLDKIIEHYYEEDLLKADGFDDAVIGIDYVNMRLIYSVKKVLGAYDKENKRCLIFKSYIKIEHN
jgi:hypothetical protein